MWKRRGVIKLTCLICKALSSHEEKIFPVSGVRRALTLQLCVGKKYPDIILSPTIFPIKSLQKSL